MTNPRPALLLWMLVPALAGAAFLRLHAQPAGGADPQALAAPAFNEAFWDHWGDGQAELAGYDLTVRRYGQPRQGTAVTIFVTETFSNSLRVKADPGRHPAEDEFPVLKLNLVKDFPTGIYDYNLMTSGFLALTAVNGRPAGTPTKIAFSSQEWCGQVWHQLHFDAQAIRSVRHSYFDGEADAAEKLDYPAGGVAEDALLFWARGLAAPLVPAGESLTLPLLRSLEHARLNHQPLGWTRVTLATAAQTQAVTVPAGDFQAIVRTAAIEDGPAWTFFVEAEPPHRILRWESSAGEEARLLGSARLAYWRMNGPGFEKALNELGLQPRPLRTP